MLRRLISSPTLVLVPAAFCVFASVVAAAPPSLPFFPPVPQTVSTVPGNGEQNPYGVAFAPLSLKPGSVLQPGDLLVSNFNNGANQQGLGTTIVPVSYTHLTLPTIYSV